MAENTNIEWCHHTFNPWVGCTKVSPACDACYAEAWSKRAGRDVWGAKADRQRTAPGNWSKPITWNHKAGAKGVRERVFCASLADVFDNHKSITPEWRNDLWELIRKTPHLDWLLLTKRPQNIKKYLPDDWGDGYPNVWLGTTVENQVEADRRIPHLLSIPATVRFLSCEPLLGPVRLNQIARSGRNANVFYDNCLTGFQSNGYGGCTEFGGVENPTINWIIAGGESGPKARPSHPDWFRSLHDQCIAADVPFLFKQWGEWGLIDGPIGRSLPAGNFIRDHNGELLAGRGDDVTPDILKRIGKKLAGRKLDGVVHDGYPKGVSS